MARLKARKTKSQQQHQDRRCPTINRSSNRSNSCKGKLQELKLAFCLLSREIQGLDEGEGQVPAAVIDEKTAPSVPATNNAAELFQHSSSVPPAVATEGDPQQQSGGSSLAAASNAVATEKLVDCLERVQAVSRTEGRKAAEAAGKEAEQALKRLNAELAAERRSRIAAERWD